MRRQQKPPATLDFDAHMAVRAGLDDVAFRQHHPEDERRAISQPRLSGKTDHLRTQRLMPQQRRGDADNHAPLQPGAQRHVVRHGKTVRRAGVDQPLCRDAVKGPG
ncbi:hypothetical protein GCM10007973_01380 [Polymorphobacter multimanifer]|nr:hypothetical protein GCM10007973_01380 [Polymorphobacter multimanifer]